MFSAVEGLSLFGAFHILRYPIELQGMFFWQKNKYFQKMPILFWILKKPNWVPADWYWRLRFENTMRHFVIISYYFLMFWQNISLCPQISAVSTIQQDSIWLLWNTKQRGHFLKIFGFSAKKHSLKLYGITQNMKSPK